MRDPTDLSGQERDAIAAGERAQRKALQRAEDIKWLMAHKQGRRLAWDWLEDARVFHQPFDSASDSRTAFNCGVRNAGLALFSEIMALAPDAFAVMQREARTNDD